MKNWSTTIHSCSLFPKTVNWYINDLRKQSVHKMSRITLLTYSRAFFPIDWVHGTLYRNVRFLFANKTFLNKLLNLSFILELLILMRRFSPKGAGRWYVIRSSTREARSLAPCWFPFLFRPKDSDLDFWWKEGKALLKRTSSSDEILSEEEKWDDWDFSFLEAL